MVDVDPELLKAALSVASKLAADAIASAAKRYVSQLSAWMKKPAPEEIARLAVDRVLAEAGAYPPKEALRIGIHAGPAEAGFDGSAINEDDRAALALRIWNRADFEIKIAKLRGALHVNDGVLAATYEIDSPSQFEVGPRQEIRYPCTAILSRKQPEVPRFRYGAVVAAAHLQALVMGPWPDVPHNEHLFDTAASWLRVEPKLLASSRLEYDDTDLVIILDNWISDQTHAAVNIIGGKERCALLSPLDLPLLDKQLKLPLGASARLLPSLLPNHGWEVKKQGARTLQAEPGEQLRFAIEDSNL